MKVRLRDWASLNCITERTVQIHIKENQEALEGHIERKGKQGTWLDDFAQEFLIEKIQLPSRKEVYQPTARENALLIELKEANKRLAEAERRAAINAEAAGKVLLLEEAKTQQATQIDTLTRENAVLSHDNEELGQKIAQAEENAQKASQELLDARKQFEDEKHLLEQQIAGMKKASLWQRIRGWK